jgi:hypothetical protein
MFLCIQRLILPRPSSRRKRPFHAQKSFALVSYRNFILFIIEFFFFVVSLYLIRSEKVDIQIRLLPGNGIFQLS